MTASDSELVASAQQGERSAFQRLLERHYDTIYRVAFRYLGNAPDAEDVAQTVCLTLVNKLGSFRGDSRFTTWLYRVVVNAARDFSRKRQSMLALQESYVTFREHDEADRAHNSERARWLTEAFTRLEPNLRDTAILVVSEDLSHAEAAEVLGCAESTVSWRMHEVRKKLKAHIEASHDG